MAAQACNGPLFYNRHKSVTRDGRLTYPGGEQNLGGGGWFRWREVKMIDDQGDSIPMPQDGLEGVYTTGPNGRVHQLTLYTYYHHSKRTFNELLRGVRGVKIDPDRPLSPTNVRWSDEVPPPVQGAPAQEDLPALYGELMRGFQRLSLEVEEIKQRMRADEQDEESQG
ncbi:hypothetical protein PHYBOEH_000373 [Phytophthora boehmeriae]|uniref:Uncharacterized protein n=1 Tax=Phytophthora boehmeriae TaxID=109152 RepID=A0A8T1WV28_9STRA|nr:hypothetical protein PHYBOEH_000373 [Phytophthora boehmeriae]